MIDVNVSYEGADLTRSCTRKKAYPTEGIARGAVATILRASPEAQVRPYACAHCGAWHVGASPQSLPSEAIVESFSAPDRADPRDADREGFIRARRRVAARRRGERGSYWR
jgi:hypothetical protein